MPIYPPIIKTHRSETEVPLWCLPLSYGPLSGATVADAIHYIDRLMVPIKMHLKDDKAHIGRLPPLVVSIATTENWHTEPGLLYQRINWMKAVLNAHVGAPGIHLIETVYSVTEPDAFDDSSLIALVGAVGSRIDGHYRIV